MNIAYNRSLCTRLPGKKAPVYQVNPTVGWIVGNSPGSRANNLYSPGSDKFTEVQLYMSTACQPGSRVIRGVTDAKSENKKGFSMSETARISSRVNKFYSNMMLTFSH